MTAPDWNRIARRWWPHAAAAVVLSVLMAWDQPIYAAIGNATSPFMDWFMERVAQLRGATFPGVLSLLMMLGGWVARRRWLRRAGAAMFMTLILTGLLTVVLKEAIGRPGPGVEHDPPGKSWFDGHYGRFPSSHSAVSFGAAGVLSAFAPAAAVPAFTMATLVSYERIYHGTHWPSDVFAGFWIGLMVARLVVSRLRKTSWREDLEHARPLRKRFREYVWARQKAGDDDQELAG